MDNIIKDIQNIKDNIYKIGNIDNERRKNILNDIKESIDKRRKEIIDANEIDVKNASYLSESMIDRLKINDKRDRKTVIKAVLKEYYIPCLNLHRLGKSSSIIIRSRAFAQSMDIKNDHSIQMYSKLMQITK